MKKMRSLIVLILFIIPNTSCVKEICRSVQGTFEFEVPVILSPAKETYRVGDTITIQSTFSDLVYERKTNTRYKLENFKFFPGTEIVKIDLPEGERFLADYFEIITDSLSSYGITFFSGGESGILGEYFYQQNTYHLGFKLVAKMPGLYYMEQGIDPMIGGNQNFEGKCSNVDNDGVVSLNEGAQNNIEMLLSSPDPHFNTWILEDPESRFHRFGGYCFRVVP